MKKQFLFILTLALVSANAFSFATFNAQEKSAETITLEEKLQSAKAAAEVKYITGTFLEGTFSKSDLNGKDAVTLKQGLLDITFTIEFKKGVSYGNIVYKAVKTAKFDTLEFNMETTKPSQEGGNPHAAVDIYAIVSVLKGAKEIQTGKIKLVTVDAISLSSGVPAETKVNNTAAPTQDGKCSRCGSNDPYHCGDNGVGPCSEKAKIPTKVITVTEKVHEADCVDNIHCNCPETSKKVKVAMEEIDVKVHAADCKDNNHCDCPTKTEYR